MTPTFYQRLATGALVVICVGWAGWLFKKVGPTGFSEGCGACLLAPSDELVAEVRQLMAVGAQSAAVDRAKSGEGEDVLKRPGLPAPLGMLPPTRREVWRRPAVEPVFKRFQEWVERWEVAVGAGDTVAQAAMEAEGVGLARERRRLLADLIQGNAERALQLAVPDGVRERLPGTVAAWLESWVSIRADYAVACALAVPGAGEDESQVVRWAEWDGERARVFTHGLALHWVTKRHVPIQGIFLPADAGTNPVDQTPLPFSRLMAMSETPVRVVEAQNSPGAGGSELVLEIGGERARHADAAAARSAAAAVVAAASYTLPDAAGGAPVAAAPLPGGDSTTVPPTAASARTEGYKRLLFLRVDFPDYTGEQATIPLAEAETLLRDMRSYGSLMSFGLHGIAPVGPGGSAITPILRMGSNASYYNNEGLSRLYPEARTKAAAAGYDLSEFDYDGVFTKSRPSAGYAGLAYVGARGFHMANGYFAKHVTTHEYGHNLGLPHAHTWDTEDKSIIGPGTVVEYGNDYDPMGDAYASIPGEKHYSGSYKNYLDWIPDADAGLVTASGLYRLTASDLAPSRGRRALRLRKDTRDYWIEFRGGLTGSLLSNSVFLGWGNSDGRENYLLDALPGVSGTTVAVGRTFSDPRANGGVGVHVTPLRKGGTFPESMDVQVTIGTPAGNQPPAARVSANTTAAPANTPVVFSCVATDPNNDALAYAWDFGDGDYSTNNEATQTHSFDSSGEYMVHCTVSDMRGGTSRSSVLVRVEAPVVYRISGRVLDPTQRPVPGVQIAAASGSDRVRATTDSAGAYTLAGLTAGAWTLTPRETVADSLNFTMPFHSSTLTVGPGAEGVDFIASTGPQEVVTSLVPKNAGWKWFSEGGDPEAGWTGAGFDDSGWDEGAGVLGYGNEDGQATTLPFGPSSSTKWTGYFFRRVFTLANPAQFPTLRLEVKRDDGVVVHLNGQEIFRDNLPSGTVTYDTQANDATEPNDYIVRNIDVATGLPEGLLVAGTNTLAVSVHQATSTSSDLAFDLALSGVAPLSGTGTAVVYLSFPSLGAVVAATEPTITLRAEARIRGGSVTKVEFFGDGVRLGESTTSPFTFDWPTPAPGSHSAHVVATWSGGGIESSAPVVFDVAPPPAILIPAQAIWKYRAATTAAPVGWQSASFDDSTWTEGPAQLGFGEGDEATIIPSGTPSSRPLTSYFRHRFLLDDPRSVTDLLARLIRDDGALVWLNGVEVIRTNLPATGTISYSTLATGAGPNAIDNAEYTFSIDPKVLVPGANVLAVEVHQSDATSSDLSFQLALEARTTAPRPRGLTLTGPASVTAIESVPLKAEGVAGSGLGLARVQFLANGQMVGEDETWPFEFAWASPPVGEQSLTAVATDTAGAVLTSPPLALTVTAPPSGTILVSFGESWRYLDEGTAPATTWRARTGFDDTAWAQGLARLGYGGDGEATVVGFGQQTSARHITTWLRKRFTVADPGTFTSLLLRLVRDDGAIVSLNGTEVVRSNLPAGTVTPTTLATSDITGTAESAVVVHAVPASLLVAGENVLAVELHQATPSSSDLGFDLELAGLDPSDVDFRFTSPMASQSISAAIDLPLSVWVAPSLGVSRVEYFAGPALIGASEAGPTFPLTWTTPLLGSYEVVARATGGDGTPLATEPITLTVDEPRASALHVPAGSSWKYWEEGTLPAANWTAVDYGDGAWKSGAGRLGFGSDNEATAIRSGNIAYYFRRAFTVASLAEIEQVVLRFQRDDGVVIYLNGVEVARDNMAAGAPLPTTLASAEATSEQGWIRRVLSVSSLRTGLNVLAAEVHQRSATSSDVGWDAELSSLGVTLAAVANTQPTTAPQPQFVSLAGPGGVTDGFELRFPETTGRLYVIESSPDLITWSPETYEFAQDGQIVVQIPSTPAAEAYYRARWLPGFPEAP